MSSVAARGALALGLVAGILAHAPRPAAGGAPIAASVAMPAAAPAAAPLQPPAASAPLAAPAAGAAVPIRIDGDFADWRKESFVAADERYLYLRFVLPAERTVQASPQPLVVAIDAGAGARFAPDLNIVFSPPATDGQGVAVSAPATSTGSGPLSHAAIDLVVAPTVAAREFELRVAREVRGRPDVTAALASGRVRVQFSLLRADGAPAWQSRVHQLALPPRPPATPAAAATKAATATPVAAATRPAAAATVAATATPVAAATPPAAAAATTLPAGAMAAAAAPPAATAALAPTPPQGSPAAPLDIPGAGAGALRIVSWNVYLASPRHKPEPFARILRALQPDVVLLQEWEGASDDELARWFDAQLPGAEPWHAVTSAGWGVAVVARGALVALGPREVARPVAAPADARRGDRALRLAAAVVTTPLGPVCAASLHLKCCGSADSAQDHARRAEATLANETLVTALEHNEPCLRVVGGDLNLVGSRRPLELLAAGLDADRTALAVAATPVLGDTATYTWSQRWSRFSPGRLDYLLYGAAAARPLRSFVVDTRRLDDASLQARGLERDDSSASDHLPLVLDLQPIQSPSFSGFANSRLSSRR